NSVSRVRIPPSPPNKRKGPAEKLGLFRLSGAGSVRTLTVRPKPAKRAEERPERSDGGRGDEPSRRGGRRKAPNNPSRRSGYARSCLSGAFSFLQHQPASSLRTISAPAVSACSLPLATWRGRGAMPQLVHGQSLSASTYLSALRRVSATCSGVSMSWLATSMAPTITFLPRTSSSSSMGTREFWHSREMVSILDACSLGKISSYCRHSEPRVFFQSV